MLLRNSHHRTRSRMSTATVAGRSAAIVVPCRRPRKKGTGHGASCPGGEEAYGPWAQPPVVDPLAAAVVFVRSQVCPAVELPAPMTDPVADAFVEATDPDAVTAFTANAPATRTVRTAIKATATVVFTRVHLLRFFSGGPRRPEAILVFHDPTRISHRWRPNPDRGVTRCPSATGFQKVFDGFRSSTPHGRHEKNLGSRSRPARPRRRALAREPLREPRVSVDVRRVVHPFREPTPAARRILHGHPGDGTPEHARLRSVPVDRVRLAARLRGRRDRDWRDRSEDPTLRHLR